MELGFLLTVAASAGVGLVFRTKVRQTVGRAVLAVGVGSLLLAVAVLGLTVAGWGPVGAYTAGLVAVVLFGLAGLALPFGFAVSLGRDSTKSDAGQFF